MEKNKQTKELLADSFHELMQHKDFEKITIRQITEEAGVIRPTFYYHFQDKYDVLEYILCRDVINPLRKYREQGQIRDALLFGFRTMERDRTFYRRAFRVTGQNAFEEMFATHLERLLSESLEGFTLQASANRLLTRQTIALYYAIGLTQSVKLWLTEHGEEVSAEELCEAYEFLLSHPIYELIRFGEEQRKDSGKKTGG